MLLSIESSCDETACALFDLTKYTNGIRAIDCIVGEVLSSQVDLHRSYGGVVPELASREHMKNLPVLISELFKQVDFLPKDLKAISVTAGPGLKGCILVGVSYAKGLGLAFDVPVYPINHLEGHILSGYSNLSFEQIAACFPTLALLVSGGHTQLILISGIGEYEILASTHDDAAGEAFDKIGSLLGLGYPAGRAVSERARLGNPRFTLPRAVTFVPEQFSFSGLKTAANLLIREEAKNIQSEEQKIDFVNDFCASVETAIVEMLIQKTKLWIDLLSKRGHPVKTLILSGGVAANQSLQSEFGNLALEHSLDLLIPPLSLCTDNAGMIAIASAIRLKKYNLLALGGLGLESFSVKARWPVTEIPLFNGIEIL